MAEFEKYLNAAISAPKAADRPARYHAIERTSPKGPGHEYVGTCWQCGKTGLTLADAKEPCENIAGLTEGESLIMAVRGQA